MIGLADVRDWLKGFGIGEHYYIGKLDAKKEKSIGVYQREMYRAAEVALGGLPETRTKVKRISVLVHWNKNARETEEAAQELFEKLLALREARVGDVQISYISLGVPEPVDVGTDDAGVYERVITFDLYYQEVE